MSRHWFDSDYAMYDDEREDLYDLQQERKAKRRLERDLIRHPNPRDPDYPIRDEEYEDETYR